MNSTHPQSMQAVVGRAYGGPETLTVETIATPEPGEGELLIEVRASSVNALDWHMRTGTPYFLRLQEGIRSPRRLVDGADVAGVVVAVGAGVDEYSIGDRVFGECAGGGFGQYLVTKPANVVPLPASVSFEAAGATGVAGLTALQGLRTHAAVQPGERVVINGAAGGVGTFAVQIAKTLGAEVTAVCSGRNAEMVRRLGADRVVDYTVDDVIAMSLAREWRYDVLFDGVGNRSAKEWLSILEPDARFVLISGPKANPWLDPIPHIASTALRVRRASQTFHQFTASPNGDDLRYLGELVADGRLVPEIQRTVGLDGVADALAEIGTGHARAKIVVVP